MAMRMDGVEITQLAGLCPVEGEGTIDGVPFYFRSRGNKWSIGIGADPMFATEWSAGGRWGVDFEAGYMPVDIAQAIIEKSAELYRVSRWDDAARARLLADVASHVTAKMEVFAVEVDPAQRAVHVTVAEHQIVEHIEGTVTFDRDALQGQVKLPVDKAD